MAQEKITINASEKTVEFLSEIAGNKTAGATICVQIVEQIVSQTKMDPHSIVDSMQFLLQIRAYSMREIKGLFTPAEWCYMADSLNGTIITPEFRCNTGGLIASVEDSNDFDNLAEKWKVDVDALIEKIKKLTGAQVDAVYSRVENFWDHTAEGNADQNSEWNLNKWSVW